MSPALPRLRRGTKRDWARSGRAPHVGRCRECLGETGHMTPFFGGLKLLSGCAARGVLRNICAVVR